MKILMTGAAGFIGSHVQDLLIESGHEVLVLDSLVTGRQENLNPKAKFLQLDICSSEAAAVMQDFKPEVLYHFAAQMDVRKSVADPKFDLAVNGSGFLNLLEAGKKSGLKKVVFASTGGAIYGEQDYFPADERHPTRPVSPYGITKLLGEKYLHYYAHNFGLDYVVLRLANVYGPRQNPHGEAGVVAIFCQKLLAGQPVTIFGAGEQTRDYVFVRDVAQAFHDALVYGKNEILNVGTEVETSVKQLYQILATMLVTMNENNKSPIHAQVHAPVYAPERPGEQARSCIAHSEIKAKLSWQPGFDIHAGLKQTFEYFKKNL